MSYSRTNRNSGGGQWVKLLAIIAFIVVLVAYALQTLGLVTWLFPADDIFMQGVTVFVCDGCCIGYSMADMFYPFKLRKSKNLVFGMWVLTFIFSTAATCIQMYLTSTHNIPHSINPTVTAIAYIIIIIAFVANILAITVVIRNEHGAGQPPTVYLDDMPEQDPAPVLVKMEPSAVPSLAAAPSRAELAVADTTAPRVPAVKKKVAGQVVANTTIKK